MKGEEEEEEKNGVKTDYTRGEKEGVDRTRVKSGATSVDTGQRGQGGKRSKKLPSNWCKKIWGKLFLRSNALPACFHAYNLF